MKNLMFLCIAFLSLTLTSCGDIVSGEGMIVTETLDVDEFTSLELSSSFDIIITQGSEQKVVAEGQQNIIDRINTQVSGDKWKADLDNGSYRNFDLTIRITTPQLEKIINDGSGNVSIESLEQEDIRLDVLGSGNIEVVDFISIIDKTNLLIDGSGNIKIADLETDDTKATIAGSGNITLNGKSKYSDLKIDGSGNFNLFDFEIENCSINTSGSGNCEVSITDDLNVVINGSGDVLYIGQPSINLTGNGSGDLINYN